MVRKRTIGSLLTPDYLRDTLGLWFAFFVCLLTVYANFNWIPALLAGAGRANASSSGLFYFNLGGIVGAVVGALAISRVGSKVVMLTLSACAVVTLIVFSTMAIDRTADVVQLFAMFALSGTMINGVQTTMYALAAHVYPVENRATGVGMAAAMGRVGGLASTISPLGADPGGSRAFFVLAAAAMIMTFVGLSVIRRHVHATAAASTRDYTFSSVIHHFDDILVETNDPTGLPMHRLLPAAGLLAGCPTVWAARGSRRLPGRRQPHARNGPGAQHRRRQGLPLPR